MNITQISLRDFRSWEHLDLEIQPGCTLLSGPNGAGKSSILEAALFAMFGATSDAGSYIRRGTDEARVILRVDTEDGLLTIIRSVRRSGGKVAVRIEEVWRGRTVIPGEWDSECLTAATTTETQAILDGLLGVSREVLLASAFSTQHGGAAFTEAAPRDRKRVLGEVLSLGMWEQLAGRARGDLQDAKYRIRIAEDLVEHHDGAEARLAGVAKVLGGARADLVLAEQAEAHAEAGADRLADEAEAAREARRQHAAAVEAAERARADHERATAVRALADEALARAKGAASNAPSAPDARAQYAAACRNLADAQSAYDAADDAWGEHDADLADARDELNDLKAESETGDCVRCGQPLVEDVSDRLRAATSKVETLEMGTPSRADMGPLVLARTDAQHAQTRLAEAEAIELLAESIDAFQEAARDAMDREMETAEHIRLTANAISEARFIDTEPEERHATAVRAVDVARVMHRDAASALARAEAAAAQAEREANAETDARTKLAAAQHDAAISEILAAGFGPNGVPALVIDNVLGQLADEANRVLAELGTPIRVDLRSQRVTQAGKFIDALDIIVLDGVDEAPYETLSGGERTRVALALRAALTRLLAAKSGARVRLLVIDEPSGLDASGAEAFADVLQAFITARIFDTALIVTHDERLADRIDRVIRVTKTPGGSSRLAENSTGPASPSIPSAGPVELQEVTDA